MNIYVQKYITKLDTYLNDDSLLDFNKFEQNNIELKNKIKNINSEYNLKPNMWNVNLIDADINEYVNNLMSVLSSI